jgi:hypothetical protein
VEALSPSRRTLPLQLGIRAGSPIRHSGSRQDGITPAWSATRKLFSVDSWRKVGSVLGNPLITSYLKMQHDRDFEGFPCEWLKALCPAARKNEQFEALKLFSS